MNARYFILTDEESNTYGVVLMEDNSYDQLSKRVKKAMNEWYGNTVKLYWDSATSFVCALNDEESREFYLTETEML